MNLESEHFLQTETLTRDHFSYSNSTDQEIALIWTRHPWLKGNSCVIINISF